MNPCKTGVPDDRDRSRKYVPIPDQPPRIIQSPIRRRISGPHTLIEVSGILTAPANSLKLPDMMTKSRLFASLWLILFVFVAGMNLGLQAPPTSPEYLVRPDLSGQRGGHLVVAVNADPVTFNRMFAVTIAHTTIAEQLSADLVHINRATFELEPALAAKWESDKTGQVYTIHLRKGLKFSDGSPFSADDALFSLQALQGSPDAFLAGQVTIDGKFPTSTKVDSHTIRVAFPRPVGMGLRALDSVPMLPRARLRKAFEEGKFSSAWGPSVPPNEVAGMGPFRLKEYQRGVKVTFERNPYYWKQDKSGQLLPYLDAITFLIIPDRNAEALRFQAGEIFQASPLNSENYASLLRNQNQGSLAIRNLGPGLAEDFLWFNLNPGNAPSGKPWVDAEKRAIFEQAEFRRAVSCALDREGMIRSILLGLGTAQYGPISSGNKIWYYQGIERCEFNPRRAREMLDRIGLRDADGDGVREFGASRRRFEITVLTARGNVAREKTAQIIKDNLQKIGIAVDAQAIPPNELIAHSLMGSFDYEAVLFGFTPTDIAPDSQTDLWYSSGRNHFWHPGQAKPRRPWEAECDALTSELVRNIDPTARLRAFQKMQQIWAREMPAIPTIAPNVLAGWNSRVGNVRPSIIAPHLLWNVEELTLSGK